MEFKLEEASAILNELVDRSLAGEEIVFVDGGRAVARLVPLKGPSQAQPSHPASPTDHHMVKQR